MQKDTVETDTMENVHKGEQTQWRTDTMENSHNGEKTQGKSDLMQNRHNAYKTYWILNYKNGHHTFNFAQNKMKSLVQNCRNPINK